MYSHPVTEKPLIIEARINEVAMREHGNPNVPYSSAEIVEEACRAWEAGASIIHWHGRDPVSGVPRNDPELYLEVIEGIRARTDALVHPTLGYISEPTIEGRLRHIRAAESNPRTAVDFVPVDFGTLNVDLWDTQNKMWETMDRVYLNPRSSLDGVLRAFKEMGKAVITVSWDIGHVRTAKRFAEQGLLPRKALWEFFLTGERKPSGAAVSWHGLQALLAELDPGDEWLVATWGDNLQAAAWAITLGGHVGIGLGDHPYTRFGTLHNGDVVALVAGLARTLGRPVARPADVRRMLEMELVHEARDLRAL
jgi:3-keto-5-aminohexanoate cleavage enzyme